MVYFSAVAAFAALLAASAHLVAAQDTYPEPITIGQLNVGHGYVLYAWSPTRTTLQDACTDSPTRTMIQSVQTDHPSNPLCNNPFALDGYTGLELLCSDGSGPAAAQVTALATNGTQTHVCTSLPLRISPLYCGGAASIWQKFVCQ
ncbi:hypothetical protein B0T24DRAFT_642126 [Lasiosphaeria ovina]|uniref:Uncharacterized protein n=1 Tax=Lasiosphaeria ovina TaxID=92902 RepID=A0AAE0JUF2_9PEZI|nr:hypothetical protein B0T24DRAFT_642126 [Lasiosphaeria ovina]